MCVCAWEEIEKKRHEYFWRPLEAIEEKEPKTVKHLWYAHNHNNNEHCVVDPCAGVHFLLNACDRYLCWFFSLHSEKRRNKMIFFLTLVNQYNWKLHKKCVFDNFIWTNHCQPKHDSMHTQHQNQKGNIK